MTHFPTKAAQNKTLHGECLGPSVSTMLLNNTKFTTFDDQKMIKKGMILMFGVLVGCALITGSCVARMRLDTPNAPSPNLACPPLPASFSESDLIGTWVAKYGGYGTDTLTLRADGTFTQIYDNSSAHYHYESVSLPWHVEHRTSGFLRLHMVGMRRCGEDAELCSREQGGLGGQLPGKYYAIDYCEGQSVEMPNEIILVATAVNTSNVGMAPRDILLRQMRLPGSEWTYSFELQH